MPHTWMQRKGISGETVWSHPEGVVWTRTSPRIPPGNTVCASSRWRRCGSTWPPGGRGLRGDDVGGVVGDLEGDGDVGLGGEVVDLVGEDGVEPRRRDEASERGDSKRVGRRGWRGNSGREIGDEGGVWCGDGMFIQLNFRSAIYHMLTF
ncbi:uncharacterized protein DS421_17g597370 [Arachis hypogaea]|nr:uncharacterized protein DS421_17g597370 [Arachis hypogaea]